VLELFLLKRDIRNIIKVASVYTGAIIGAGFASGREILQFFSNYYKGGFYGILLAGILFSLIGYIILDRVYKERIKSYDEFVFPSMGWVTGWVVEIAVTLSVLSLFSVMLAGMGRVFEDELSIPFKYSVIIIAFVCAVIILNSIKAITAVNAILTPVMTVGMILTGLYIIIFKDKAVFNIFDSLHRLTDNWFMSSILYVSYNCLMSVVVMCKLLPYLSNKWVGRVGGIMGGMSLCFAALLINSAICLFLPESARYELPMLDIAEKYNELLSTVYTVILWLAMFTSATIAGFCFVERVCSKTRLNPKIVTILSCALAVPLAHVGFSGLIATIYPVFGYVGLFVVFIILFQGLQKLLAGSKKKRT